MKRSFGMIFILTFGFGIILGNLSTVCAQNDGSDEFTLEEITVTAQKRNENQQNVAINMDVVSSEAIRELGKNDISEILSDVSGALIQKAADGYRVAIHGMSDMSNASHGQSMATPTVGINTDGIFSNRKDSSSGLYDIERVEVLYGPQSTLYTSNSPGGIINIVTAQPKLDKYEASGSLEYGSYNLLHTEGAMNVPVGDAFAVRASFTTSTHDAYLTTGSDNEDSKSARLRGLFQPNDSLSIVITGEIARDGGTGAGGGVERFADESDSPNPWTGNEEDSRSANNQKTKKLNAQINWETGIGSLSITPSYLKRDGNARMTISGDEQSTWQKAEEKSLELRMTSSEEFFFKWIAGATYYDSYDANHMLSDDYVETGEGQFRHTIMEETIRAAYANITFPVTDIFRTTVGYRMSWDDFESTNNECRNGPFGWETENQNGHMELSGRSDYKVGIEYDLRENSMLYADYSTSYRVQGMGFTDQQNLDNPPEILKAYTIGAKNRFFENKLQANVSAYYYDYKDFHAGGNMQYIWLVDVGDDLEITDQMAEGTYDRNNGAHGDGTVMGFDLSLDAIITANDMLNLSVSYINSEWDNLFFDFENELTLAVVGDHTEWVPVLDQDYSGKPMMNTPPWTVSLTYNHNFNLPNGGVIKAGFNTKYMTAYDLSWKAVDYPYSYQESYHMENINMSYTHSDGKWILSAYVKNLTDYAEKRKYQTEGNGGFLQIGNPRTYGAVLSIKY